MTTTPRSTRRSAGGARRARVLERGVDGSAVTVSELPNGLRVVTESVPGARSASVGVWVGVGSVDETARLAGASHYLEHLLFKGTHAHTGYEIADAFDAVGGEFNAFTAHEYTCYYARVLAQQAEMAVSLVSEVVLDAVIATVDVDTERSVILEEIAMRDDDPEDTLADAFAAVVFAGHPVADPVIGTNETIAAMSRAQVAGYYRRRYTPDKMVLAVAGGVEHGDVVRWARAALGRFPAAGLPRDRSIADGRADLIRPAPPRAGSPVRRRSAGAGPRLAVLERDIEQVHLSVGVRSGPRGADDRAALAVLTGALGGGMSSRLFRSIREERGLAYSVYAGTSTYADVGSFSVYAGCQPEHLGDVATLIGAELEQVAEHGVSDTELRRVQGQLTGSLILALEDTESRMSRIGKNLLVRSDYRSVDDELAEISAVTADQVRAVAGRLLSGPRSAAVVGPFAAARDLPPEVTRLVG